MAQLYKAYKQTVLHYLNSVEFRINPRVSTKEIKKDYFNMIDSNFSLFYSSSERIHYHRIKKREKKIYNPNYLKIVNIDNNLKTIEVMAGTERSGIVSKIVKVVNVQSVLRREKLDNISRKISKNIAELRKRVSEWLTKINV